MQPTVRMASLQPQEAPEFGWLDRARRNFGIEINCFMDLVSAVVLQTGQADAIEVDAGMTKSQQLIKITLSHNPTTRCGKLGLGSENVFGSKI